MLLTDIFAPVRWAYALYVTRWRVWTLSIPVAALRVDPVIRNSHGLSRPALSVRPD